MALRKKRQLPHQRRRKQNIRQLQQLQMRGKSKHQKNNSSSKKHKEVVVEEEDIGMFGVELVKLMELQGDDAGDVPMLLTVVLDKIIELDGLETEGIFRVNGNMREVDAIANEGFDPDAQLNYSVHTWASLLKKWIRELPSPLVPQKLYPRFVMCESIVDMQLILEEIHNPNQAVIDTIGLFFGRLLQQESVDKTKMDVDNFAKVLTPTIFPLRASKLDLLAVMEQQKQETNSIKLLLLYYTSIYKEKQEREKQEKQLQQQHHQQDDLFVNNYEKTTSIIENLSVQ